MGVHALAQLRYMLPQGKGLAPEDWRRRHRGMLAALWLHVVGVPAFALAQDHSVGHSLLETIPLVTAALVAHSSRLRPALRAGAVAVGLLTSSALLVHFSGGYIEFHFHFFVVIALLALYQHWFPFLLAIAYVVVHHGLAGALDATSVYNHPDAIEHPWRWAAIHGVFVVAASAASVFTWRMAETEQRRRSDLEAVTEAALARLPLVQLLDEILARVSRIVRADAATLSLVEGDRLVVRTAHGASARTREVPIHSLADRPEGRVLATGEPAVGSGRDGGASALVPLVVEGSVTGILDVSSAHAGRFGEEQVRMLQLVADRIAPSIDRARLYEREHDIAETLQRSLLPKQHPTIEGVDVAARYRPAGPGTQVGGDWYDVLPLPDGKVGVAIGDVVGHGIDAAVLMGQLRTGLRAYAAEGCPPRAMAEKLSALLRNVDEGQIATLLYMELAPETGELRYVCAGHMPPLLRNADGETIYLDEGRTVPLGVLPQRSVAEGRALLEPGGALVLFTDGLIERRGEAIDAGLSALQDLVGELELDDAEELSDEVLEGLALPPTSDDDVALVVLRREDPAAGALCLTFPAEPGAAHEVRKALRRWLRDLGAGEDDVFPVVLAASEAASNAIEHAYNGAPGRFRLKAYLRGDAVEVTVRDTGRWRVPTDDPGRGRGLPIIDDLVDHRVTESSSRGTSVRLVKRLGVGSERVAVAAGSAPVV